MNFYRNLIKVGTGRLSSARQEGDTVVFVLVTGGCMIEKRLQIGGRQVYGGRRTGYYDDAWYLPGGKLQRLGEALYYEAVQ